MLGILEVEMLPISNFFFSFQQQRTSHQRGEAPNSRTEEPGSLPVFKKMERDENVYVVNDDGARYTMKELRQVSFLSLSAIG